MNLLQKNCNSKQTATTTMSAAYGIANRFPDLATRMLRQPNFGRADGESDESYIKRLQYAMMDSDKNNRIKEPEKKAGALGAAQPGGALPIRQLPTAGSRVARMPSAGCR
jgi:hypothetical protein